MGCVVFDLDGTLADTSGDLLEAANACFRRIGAGDMLTGADAGTALRGGKAMLRLGLSRLGRATEEEIDRLYPRLLEAYGNAICRHTFLYPGAMEAVAALSESGRGVAICTNKPEALAEDLLRQLGVRDAFAALIGADTLAVRKPDPAPLIEAVRRAGGDPARACLVGDSDTDRRTAAAAGMPSILVTFSPAGQSVRDLAPEAVIDHFDALPDTVTRLLGPA